MSAQNAVDFDVAVIGGGPAGSTTASYLARAGLKVLVVEREQFPRPHVGESLVPSTTVMLDEIGALAKVDAAGFPKKYGAAWTASHRAAPHQGAAARPEPILAFTRFAYRPQVGVNQDYTYHVDRGRFDQLLLQHAGECGAEVLNGPRVLGVDFADVDRPIVRLGVGSREMGIPVRMVVDASGRKTLLGSQLQLKTVDPVFDQFAVHTWFEGYERTAFSADRSMDEFIYIHFLPLHNSWVWQIPINETTTSVGVVTQRRNFGGTAADREAFFWKCVADYPALYDGLRAARQAQPFKAEGDYSYSMKQIAGDGYVLVGDAARFVDPIFSSGVSIAMQGARQASACIIAAAAAGDFRRHRFAEFEKVISRGTRNWYEFISLYYRLNILFSTFLQDPRYHLDILKLLQGELYDEDRPEVLRVMRQTVTEVERRPDHPWNSYLGSLVVPAPMDA